MSKRSDRRMPRLRSPSEARGEEWDSIREGAQKRMLLIGAVFALGVAAVVARAYDLQIRNGQRYVEAADRQASTSERGVAKRGVIKDRHDAELAITVDVDSIFAEPKRIEDPAGAAKKLAPILGLPEDRLLEKLKQDRYFTYLRRKVGADVAARVRELAIKGIDSRPEPQRFYADHALASHVLGFMGTDGHGKAGLERQLDESLRGKSFEVPGLRDALGHSVLQEGFVPEAVLEGEDVRLSIDRHVQYVTESELEKAIVENGANAGVAIVMRANTGEILALASYPTFNPNDLAGTGPKEHQNRAISSVFEPGSTMKVVTIAGALEDRVVTPQDRFDCEMGRWHVASRTIRDTHPHGVLTVPEVLKVSSNICTAKIGLRMGRESLHSWARRFGFGEPTGVELPGELRGLLRHWEKWREISLVNIAFGQGIAVTPLQVVQAVSVVASGGMFVRPRLVLATKEKTPGSIWVDRPVANGIRVVSEQTARQVTEMMMEVTRQGGTATKAAIPGFTVAGKTGTAQKIDPVTRAYSRSLYTASFVGFVPAEKPEIVALVLLDEPKKSIYGGIVAAPAFKNIAIAALSALEVFPEDPEARTKFLTSFEQGGVPAPSAPVPTSVGLTFDEVVGCGSEGAGRCTRPAGDDEPMAAVDPAVSPSLAAWESALESDAIDAEDDLVPRLMPNFTGLGVREVLDRSAEVGCDLVLNGTGRVVSQDPPAGAKVTRGDRCELVLSPEGKGAGSET
ncbi:MAG: transpeptidase family protein [Deltaproteobacteria bacterium]|nr:transpeptidase family protein [Deltaproteobacteria bacterium]